MNKDKLELSKMDLSQLIEKLDDYRRDLFQIRLKSTTSSVGDTSQFKKLRKNIARALTLIKQKENN
jgi:large subunit ribosomal protein L29